MVELLHITCDWCFKDYTCSLADTAAGSGRQVWSFLLPGKRKGGEASWVGASRSTGLMIAGVIEGHAFHADDIAWSSIDRMC